MKFLIQTALILFASLSIHQSITAQDSSEPIYASINTETIATATSIKVDKTTNTDALRQIANQIKEVVKFPFEEGSFRNKLQIMVELDVDKKGNVKNTRVHNTDNEVLTKNILESLSKLEKVTPIVMEGKRVSKTIFIPLTFQF